MGKQGAEGTGAGTWEGLGSVGSPRLVCSLLLTMPVRQAGGPSFHRAGCAPEGREQQRVPQIPGIEVRL